MVIRYEPDNWHPDGSKILSEQNIALIKEACMRGPIIVRQWFYRAARGPEVYCFADLENFEEHLQDYAKPGDAFDVWSFNEVCKDGLMLAEGKVPDTDGCTPRGGAY